ncbi:MAG: insulinase family protein [Helicobacteraceae bacterium]|jgi:predicted Zn-dependent peptidase|nr:insulinase family protein [Helicobacteraceae bacterium]
MAIIIDSAQDRPLLLESDHKLPIVYMQIVFLGSGSISDGNLAGLASLSADLLEEGTKKLGVIAFAEKLEERAIRFGVNVGRETLSIDLSSLKAQFGEGFDLLKSLLADPNLTEKTLVKIKEQAIGELSRKQSDFDYVAEEGLRELLFEGSALALPTTGTAESIAQIKLENIRRFLKTAIARDRAVVLFGGDITLEEAKQYANSVLTTLPHGSVKEIKFIAAGNAGRVKTAVKNSEQAYIYFGAPFDMPFDSEESYKATVASFILGGSGFGSRLMEEIRVKRGLAYSAYSYTSLGQTSSTFKGHLQTKLESQEEAKKIVLAVVKEFVQKGATQKELDEAKRFLLGSEPLRNETMNGRLNRAFGDFYRKKPMGWSSDQLQKIGELTLKELNDFIAAHSEILNLSFFIVTNRATSQ